MILINQSMKNIFINMSNQELSFLSSTNVMFDFKTQLVGMKF